MTTDTVLPLEGTPLPTPDGGWSVRLAVRAEQVTLHRQTVVVERVRVWRQPREEVAHVEATLRREVLRVDEEKHEH